jgi:hypothetical protein
MGAGVEGQADRRSRNDNIKINTTPGSFTGEARLMSTPEIPSVTTSASAADAAPAVQASEAKTSAAQREETRSPFHSAEAFDAYCQSVQARLAAYAVQRSDFLQSAYDRLTRLLLTARAMEDAALYHELMLHRMAVHELLETLKRPPEIREKALSSLQNRTHPGLSANRSPVGRIPPNVAAPTLSAPVPTPVPSVDFVPRQPQMPRRPLAQIEAGAIELREKLKDWNERHPLTNGEGDRNVPNCLRLRAIACLQRRLKEESGDKESAEVTELGKDIVALMQAARDREYTVALDEEIDPPPTAWQWGELAERYEEVARAQEAFEWWNRHHSVLVISDIQPLAEAVASTQQRFNRLLFRVGVSDPFQQALFDNLRAWARDNQCYLFSLRPKVPLAELAEKAAILDEAWEKARSVAAGEEARQATAKA